MMYGGATSLQFKSNRYPNIAEFLNQKYPDLYDIANALNRLKDLTSTMPTGFILPDEKGRKNLLSMIQGEKCEDAEEVFLGLIMRGDYIQADSAAKGINTATNKQILVDKVENGTIHIEGGGKLTKCNEFQPFTRRTGKFTDPCKHSVWNLTGNVIISKKENELRPLPPNAKRFNSVVGRGESYEDDEKLLNDAALGKAGVVNVFMTKLGQWCRWAKANDMESYKSFSLVKTGSPTIDYLMVFHSGVFTEGELPDDIQEKGIAVHYNECTWSGPVANAESTRESYASRQFKVLSKAKEAYDVEFVKKYPNIFEGTKFWNNSQSLFALHAFIFYGNLAMEKKYERDHESKDIIGVIFNYARNSDSGTGFVSNNETIIDASRFGLTENDITGMYHEFIKSVAFRAPVNISIIHGAGENDLSDDTMEELRAYVMAHGKFPQV